MCCVPNEIDENQIIDVPDISFRLRGGGGGHATSRNAFRTTVVAVDASFAIKFWRVIITFVFVFVFACGSPAAAAAAAAATTTTRVDRETFFREVFGKISNAQTLGVRPHDARAGRPLGK